MPWMEKRMQVVQITMPYFWSPAVRVWGPKVRHCRNYNQKHYFCLRFVVSSFYTGSFQVPPEKNHPQLKCQFPPKIPIWIKSLLYKPSEKWLNPPSIITHEGKGGCKVWLLPWRSLIKVITCRTPNRNLDLDDLETLKYWVGVQRGQSNLMGRRCLFSLGWPPF